MEAVSRYAFEPPPPSAVPIRGRDVLYPIRRIFCVGRNYEAHAREMGAEPDREAPFYFTKSAYAFAPSGASIPYAPGTSNLHYEMELVVAIGAPAFHVSAADALECVFGYGCGLDMTRRDLQLAAREQRRPWDLGKDFESAAVLAPIVPAAECGHLHQGRIELKVNGTQRQSSDLKLMIHPVAALIADLSKFYHLQPGDLLYTGTPEGVGPVLPNDRITGSIQGLGEITVHIGAAE
jgi:fumarylpyruvate hydrolase